MKTVKFITLGCKVNMYETEAMTGLFEKSGYIAVDGGCADVTVINPCPVTAVSDKKSRQMIRRARKLSPNGIVVVVGCYSQVSPEAVREMPDVDIILGTTDRKNIVGYVEEYKGKRHDYVSEDIITDYEELSCLRQLRTRAVIKIQDGCDNFCSYCIIPYARGCARTRSPQSAADEVARLTLEEFSEFVLVGIHLDGSLIDTLKLISSIDGVKRIRLGSLDPNVITEEFATELSKTPNLCRHFHISLQSGSDAILKTMNRKYTAAQYTAYIECLKSAMPDCAITTDVIVGFPGETDNDFRQTVEMVESIGFCDVHVFPYSQREGTAAAVLDGQLENSIKVKRAAELMRITDDMRKNHCEKMIGNIYEVLFENNEEGLTTEYVRVKISGYKDLVGKYKNVKITECCGDYCMGKIV